jgi:hypothetical protein
MATTGSSDPAETYYRTQGVSTGLGQENNPDGDAFTNGVADQDSDNDGLLDGWEAKFYGSNQTNPDVDGDGCPDGVEAADVNGDRRVNAIDLGQIAQRFSNDYRTTHPEWATYDVNKDGRINSADLGLVAQRFGSICPPQTAIPYENHAVW